MSGPAGPVAPVAFLAAARPAVEAALARVADGLGEAHPVAQAAGYALRGEGKRLRPLLCVAAWRAVRRAAAPPAVYDLAAALEIVHTYSLVHDDLPCMDDDALRRGRPTAHRVHGSAAAVLAGAALLPLAAGTLVRAARGLALDDARTARLVDVLMGAAGAAGMVGGQHLDLAAEGRPPQLADLGAIHARKTGALLAAAPRMGALAAGADGATAGALGRYGEALGLAFQIADDVLDVTGETAVLGKEAGRDTARDKATYPALLGVDGARARAREAADAALAALTEADVDGEELNALARFVVERDR